MKEKYAKIGNKEYTNKGFQTFIGKVCISHVTSHMYNAGKSVDEVVEIFGYSRKAVERYYKNWENVKNNCK